MTTPEEAPSRWQGQQLQNPPLRVKRLSRLLGIQIRPDDADVIRLRKGLMRGDPVADRFVIWSKAQPPGEARRVFETVVEEGLDAVPDAPECLRRWFEPLESRPSWLDDDALRLGCRTALRVGPAGGMVLSAVALMGGYRSSAAVKPLAMTGALDKMVIRRIGETSRFVLDVYDSGDLSRFSAGFKSACRVRLMHAMVRHSLLKRADWDTAAWGVPINQADMAATHLEFSSIFLTGLMALGYRFSAQERQAVMHLWRYVSVVMGGDDELLAHDYRAGLRQMLLQTLTNPHADADSRALAKALHELPVRFARNRTERLLAQLVTRQHTAVSRLVLGDEAADDIGLPAAPLHKLLLLGSAARFGLESVERVVPRARAYAERRGREKGREITNELLGGDHVDYVPYADRGKTKARPRAAWVHQLA